MREQQHNLCELLISYMAGDCAEAEHQRFERHLSDCPACRLELAELREVWNALPLEAEEVQVPDDLKRQVMKQLFGGHQVEAVVADEANRTLRGTESRSPRRRWMYAMGAALSVFCIWVAVTAWENRPGQEDPQPVPISAVKPAQVIRTIDLRSADPAKPDCKGTVWQMRKDETEQLVVKLQGLDQTRGTEAYQVWLIHSGKRYNGGTLLVNENGEGVLTYTMSKDDPPFEAIGVTLEPDARGTQPRGKKVLGS